MTVNCRKDKNYPPDECCEECAAEFKCEFSKMPVADFATRLSGRKQPVDCPDDVMAPACIEG